jgi:hypothetical protein
MLTIFLRNYYGDRARILGPIIFPSFGQNGIWKATSAQPEQFAPGQQHQTTARLQEVHQNA